MSCGSPFSPAFPPTEYPTPAPTPDPNDSGWVPMHPGLEQRVLEILVDNTQVDHLLMARIDPTRYHFEIEYNPELPLSLEEWQAQTSALVVVNGGYFRILDERYLPAGLLIVDGQVYGESYGDFAGMFLVTPSGPQIRWLTERPYNTGESILFALQSFPMLVKPGGSLGFAAEHEDSIQARRTVLGQDRAGRIIFLVASRSHFTLHQLSRYLVESDLDLEVAVNLDGGPSSGMVIAGSAESVSAYSTLPIVITTYPDE